MRKQKPAVKTAVVTARIDPKLLKDLDKMAKVENVTRSTFIAHALEHHILGYWDAA